MKYFIRSAKYFVALCVLCVALMVLMLLTGTSELGWEETFYLMFHSDRFLLLGVAIVALAATYPRFGFIKRTVEGSVTTHRTQIESAFHASGFRFVKEEQGVLYFRGDGLWKRLILLFEDEVTVRQTADEIEIEGIRRAVATIVYRLDGYIEMVKRNEK
ncbi:MAG: hypothetical protein Q4A18_00565 [Rikenellaceae bacterium]|nr:hypothetical protein [Rikenellaceae bacterium]